MIDTIGGTFSHLGITFIETYINNCVAIQFQGGAVVSVLRLSLLLSPVACLKSQMLNVVAISVNKVLIR